MLDEIKSLIPLPLKRAVRRNLLDPFWRLISDRQLEQSVRVLRTSIAPSRYQIEKFRRAWGNEAFSADVTYVSEVLSHVRCCTGSVLECGSGLTTLAAALAAEGRDITIWSLEQDPEWAEIVGRRLRAHDIRNVILRHAPLKDYGGYVWYDVSRIDLPNHFALVLCDGPAVFKEWGDAEAQWRYGVLPVLSARAISVSEILLDDAEEPRAANVLRSWRQEFGLGHRMLQTADGDCAIVGAQS